MLTILDRSRAPEGRSRTGRFRLGWSGSTTRGTLTDAGHEPETELPSQTGPEPESDAASLSRTEREPTWPRRDEPDTEPTP